MTLLGVILWGFSLLLHHSSTEFSKRVNRPLGKRGTSVSTLFRFSKASLTTRHNSKGNTSCRQRTAPAASPPAQAEALSFAVCLSYHFLQAVFSDSSNLMRLRPPLKGSGILPVLPWGTQHSFL